MMFGLVRNRKKKIFKEKPELGIEEKCAWFGFFIYKLIKKMDTVLNKVENTWPVMK